MHNCKKKKAAGKELTRTQAWLEENQPKYMKIKVNRKEGKGLPHNGSVLVWKDEEGYRAAKAKFKKETA